MRKWDREKIFSWGDQFFSSLLEDIARAKKSILIETYIFCDDTLGRSVVEALNKASQRGVKIQFLVDGVGSSLSAIKFLYSALASEIEKKVYHPVPWSLTLGSLQNSSGVKAFLRLLFGINRRNHRKSCILDNTIAYAGSMNISEAHVVGLHGHKPWRDTGVRIEGLGVHELSLGFINAWSKAEFNNIKSISKNLVRRKQACVRLNDTWSMRHRLFLDLLRRIETAQKRIWITNAYFVPHGRLVRAISDAGKRGVDVRVLVPRYCDIFFIPLVRSAFYSGLLKSGVRIFEYLPTMLHAKTILIDRWAMVGSSNMNHRSLWHDLELDIVLTHESSLSTLTDHFLNDLKSSAEINQAQLIDRPWLQTGSGQALLLLKNWM